MSSSMATQGNPALVQRYFRKVSIVGPVILIVIGALIALCGLATRDVTGIIIAILLGGGLAAGGGYWLYSKTANVPTDSQIDQLMEQSMASLQAAALAKLNLDPEEVKLVEPVVATGYAIRESSLVKQGKDRRTRGNVVTGMIILFSDHEMHTFTKRVDLANPTFQQENTGEYFYKDVVSIETRSEGVRLATGQQVTLEELAITTSGGTSISNTLFDTGRVAASLNGARQLIKMKKREQ
jgi:hypothetical protein